VPPPDSPYGWGNRPHPGGPGQPARVRPPRPTRPPEPALRQRAYAALFLAALSVVALFGIGGHFDFHRGVYLVIFALVVGAAACWLGATAMRRARLAASMRPRGAMLGTVFGAISALLSAFLLIILAVFWGQFTTYSRCIDAANTMTAQQACLDQLNHSLNSEISKLEAAR
jgi:predicted PurR-regulated permease PerM